jgi:hypothetical protein
MKYQGYPFNVVIICYAMCTEKIDTNIIDNHMVITVLIMLGKIRVIIVDL